jgi:hypothetical protein
VFVFTHAGEPIPPSTPLRAPPKRGNKVRRVDLEALDYVALAQTIEELAAAYEQEVPRLEYEKLRPTPEHRAKVRAREEAAQALLERAEEELPAGIDLLPVSLARRALLGVASECHSLLYGKLRRDRFKRLPKTNDQGAALFKQAVESARRLRDCGPEMPRVERLLESLGTRRALESLADDLRKMSGAAEGLDEQGRHELRIASDLVRGCARRVDTDVMSKMTGQT